MTVAKKFDGVWYRGRITSIDVDDKGKRLYHIEYNDGDREDMHYKECIDALSARPDDEDEDSEDEDSEDEDEDGEDQDEDQDE